MSNVSTPYYKALDFSLIFLSCCIAYWLRFSDFSLPLYYFLPTAIFALTSTISLGITGFYSATNSDSSLQQVVAAISGLIVSVMLTIACLYLTKTGEDYSRIWLVTSFIFSLTFLLGARLLLKHVFHISTPPRVVVLLGHGPTSHAIKSRIDLSPSDGISISKHFTTLNKGDISQKESLLEVAQYIEDCRENPNIKNPVTEVWVTHDVFAQFSHAELASAFDNSSITLVYIPELPKLGAQISEHIEVIAGIPTINSKFSKHQKLGQLIKFLEDQLIAWCLLILLAPLMLIIAVVIRLESNGPAIYKQQRYGLGGKSFQIWKFRTMHSSESNAEFKQAELNDPRVTKVGRWLRKTSLDELPQLFNVISGSMSIVGPRPHPELLNEQHRGDINQYMYRHASKPGITGLAQVKGFRGETKDPRQMEQRVKYDLEYVNNWSLVLDIKILLLTFNHLVTTEKAH